MALLHPGVTSYLKVDIFWLGVSSISNKPLGCMREDTRVLISWLLCYIQILKSIVYRVTLPGYRLLHRRGCPAIGDVTC